jgi:chemotaxis protein MotA
MSPMVASQPKSTPLDVWMLAGIAIALAATIGGIRSTGVNLVYFLQPTGALIVLGGTWGITLITTPRNALRHCARRITELFRPENVSREALIEEIVSYAKLARIKGLLGIDPLNPTLGLAGHAFLRDTHTLAMEAGSRDELQATLETKVRLRERQGEMDARVLEVAGGFAPTIGVLGTVVGLIEVLRQFSNLPAVALGIGTAFVSTIYGLALANLLLLPIAHRIRAGVAERFETEEMMVEAWLCLFDGTHHSLVRERLTSFVRPAANR